MEIASSESSYYLVKDIRDNYEVSDPMAQVGARDMYEKFYIHRKTTKLSIVIIFFFFFLHHHYDLNKKNIMGPSVQTCIMQLTIFVSLNAPFCSVKIQGFSSLKQKCIVKK